MAKLLNLPYWQCHFETNLKVFYVRRKKAPREKFEFFLKFCTEPEVEDILTIYTQENKSASVFLGAKKPKQKTDSSR